MGFMDKIKDKFYVPEDDFYEEEEPQEASFSDSKRKSSRYEEERFPTASQDSTYSGDSSKNRIVNIHATTQLQVVLVKPERFDDAPTIANHLNDKKTVVVNLESANKEVQRRLIDFLSGVAYANRGQIKRVANSTFIITPFNVDIMGDMLIDELESNGMYL